MCVMLILLVLPSIILSTKPTLNTKLGLIQGLEADDGDYFMFLGIPYAKVNESNPFGESLPQPPFETIYEAYNDNIMCPQKDEFNHTIQGTINCLTLNIYVPKSANSTNKLPVLLFIYGGNYKIGFNGRYLYGPKYLVRHDIIVVILNYRLGPYGFLCLGIPEVPGNQGHKDQKKALKWVYNHIEEFGGDKNKITINGHSFGAISVDMILHSLKEGEKLFDKVILQSGNNVSPLTISQISHEQHVLKMAEYLSFNTNDVNKAIAFLSCINSSSVIEASLKVQIPYWYCNEKTFENVDKLIPSSRQNIKIPGARNVSFMMGNTENESRYIFGFDVSGFTEYLDPIVRSFKKFNMTKEESNKISTWIYDIFVANSTFNPTLINKLIQLGIQHYFLRSSSINILRYLENGARETYYYLFSYEGQRNFMTRRLNLKANEGATHADEIPYLFDVFFMEKPLQDDKLIIDRMTTLWANFVKYGNPTPVTTKLLPVKWTPYSRKNPKYLKIDTILSLKSML